MSSGGHSGRRLTHYPDDKNARGLRALVDHFPDAPRLVVGDVKRAVRAHGDTSRTMGSGVGVLLGARKAIGEDLVLRWTNRFPVGEGNEHDVVSLLRSGRAVPRAVEGDESPALVVSGKRCSGIEHEAVRRPVGRKKRLRSQLRCALTYCFAVPGVLGRQHELLLKAVVIAIRPAVITTLDNLEHLLGGQILSLVGCEQLRA